jgi:hypothetical protein
VSEMIERVAAVIEGRMFAPFELPLDVQLHGYYLDCARAVIEAMRDPTDTILNAGPPEPYMDRDVWAVMIDAALK